MEKSATNHKTPLSPQKQVRSIEIEMVAQATPSPSMVGCNKNNNKSSKNEDIDVECQIDAALTAEIEKNNELVNSMERTNFSCDLGNDRSPDLSMLDETIPPPPPPKFPSSNIEAARDDDDDDFDDFNDGFDDSSLLFRRVSLDNATAQLEKWSKLDFENTATTAATTTAKTTIASNRNMCDGRDFDLTIKNIQFPASIVNDPPLPPKTQTNSSSDTEVKVLSIEEKVSLILLCCVSN